MFIATANGLDNDPGAASRRMEILQLPGYIEEDKVADRDPVPIPGKFPKTVSAMGKSPLTPMRSAKIIQGYTREAGVRQLEREIGTICVASPLASREGNQERPPSSVIRTRLSWPAKFFNEIACAPACRRGYGLGVDAFRRRHPIPSKRLKWPVMAKLPANRSTWRCHEGSAQAAMSLVSRARSHWALPRAIRKQDIHVHIPAGAIPKDGPSAGVLIRCVSCRCFSTSACERLGHDRRNQLARSGAAGGGIKGKGAWRPTRGIPACCSRP